MPFTLDPVQQISGFKLDPPGFTLDPTPGEKPTNLRPQTLGTIGGTVAGSRAGNALAEPPAAAPTGGDPNAVERFLTQQGIARPGSPVARGEFLSGLLKGVESMFSGPSVLSRMQGQRQPERRIEREPGQVRHDEMGLAEDIALGFAGGEGAKRTMRPTGSVPPVTGPVGPQLPPAPGVGSAVSSVGNVIKKIFSPTTVSNESQLMEGSVRQARGTAERDTAVTRAAFEPFQRMVNAMSPADQTAFVDYIERRSKGAQIPDPALQPVADSIREAVDERKMKLQSMPSTQQMQFVNDYYAHYWKNPKQAQQFLNGWFTGGGKQGSGKSLKKRSIPTLADGIAAGLEPITTNPLDMTMMYVENMDRFIAANQVFDHARANGTVKYFAPGSQPVGWAPIEGRLARKTITTAPTQQKPAHPMQMQAYMPEDAARVYNNFISRGVHGIGGGEYGQVYDAVQRGVNSVTAMELGFSGFHASTMAYESIVNDVARAVGQFGYGVGKIARGQPVAGGKEIVKGILRLPKSPAAPINYFMKGRKFEQQYLKRQDYGPDFRKIVDLGEKVGIRGVGYDRAMKSSAMGSFYNAFKHGSLKAEMMAAGADIRSRPVLGAVTQLAKNWGRLMDTVAQPLFEYTIPRLKNGAFYGNMKDWLEAHPNASNEEQLVAGRVIADSVDNRFGELIQDNLFWNKMLKQASQIFLRASGWDLGTQREIAGAFVKQPGFGRWSPRTQYIIALPIVTAISNAIWTYLKTGQSPQTIDDLFTYRTGGTNPDGTPEKAMVPGYMRDVLGYTYPLIQGHPEKIGMSIGRELAGKIATAPKLVFELMTNRDYHERPTPITDPNQGWLESKSGSALPDWVKNYARYVGQQFVPISVKTFAQRKTGSGVTVGESLLGNRPAPFYLQAPKTFWDSEQKYGRELERRREYIENYQKQQEGGGTPLRLPPPKLPQ